MAKTNSKKSGLCPLCLKMKKGFDRHHVAPRVDGGSDCKENLIDICKTCHIIITRGSEEDSVKLQLACMGYQLAKYGNGFFVKRYKDGSLNKRDDGFGQVVQEAIEKDQWCEFFKNGDEELVRQLGAIMYVHEVSDYLDLGEKLEGKYYARVWNIKRRKPSNWDWYHFTMASMRPDVPC